MDENGVRFIEEQQLVGLQYLGERGLGVLLGVTDPPADETWMAHYQPLAAERINKR